MEQRANPRGIDRSGTFGHVVYRTQTEESDMSKETLDERLEPKHLTGDEAKDVLQAEAKALAEPEAGDEPKNDDPKLRKEYHFDFEWTDGRGRLWKGHFANKILDIRNQQLVGVQRARFALGMPIESLDDLTVEINLMAAHMMISLEEKPVWAEDLLALDDVRLLQELYMEVLAHEATFRGRGRTEEEG